MTTEQLTSLLNADSGAVMERDFLCYREQIVKAADKLSAHIKCLEELKAGNREFSRAAEQTLAALESHDLPELKFFMAHFLPAFSLTLDELD